MKAPAIPDNEAQRLADLYEYGILDTPAEKIFDEVAELAATICGTEIGAVTLVDRDRQWFKAEHGIRLGQTTRDESVCGHAILETELFEVRDTQEDERFVGNPVLSGNPAIRFYGGSRLLSERGNAIGMLCVMDTRPRELSPQQRKALEQLSDVLMAVLDAGRKMRFASWFGTLVDKVQDEILIIDPQSLRYLHANRAALDHLGYTLDEMRRLTPMDVLADQRRERYQGFVARLQAGEPFITFEGVRCRSDAQTYPVESRWQLLDTGTRNVVLSIVHDITERREAERMKDDYISRLNRELELARAMQTGLLPAPAELLGVRAAWFFRASSFVGGDTFEYLPVDDRHLAFFMLDVAGHGVTAAMMALSAQHQLTGLVRRDGCQMLAQGADIARTATTLLTEWNRRALQQKDWDLYVTAVLGLYDSRDRRLAVVQAGHPPALASLGRAERFVPIGEGGLPVGILPAPEYEAHVVEVPAGSRIVLCSDGVLECTGQGGAAFGADRLAGFLARERARPAADLADLLGRELAAWRGTAGFEDDVTFLALDIA